MSYLQTYQVFPNVPEPLRFLEELSRNLWWCWHLDAIELFRRISPSLWNESGRNPIVFATLIPQDRLEELAKDDSFLAHQKRVKDIYDRQVLATADSSSDIGGDGVIAYFSMEYGIHESLPMFAGGLGVLAGDHLKAASDMGLPLVGVGLLYRKGYFHQYLDQEGWQQEEYPETNLYHLPLERAKDEKGREVHIMITGPQGNVRAMVWKMKVGRISFYLLDTNLQENPVEVRDITARLYTADAGIRLAQEVLLGIGGMRALRILGIRPKVCHMNEGHCAFIGLERLAQMMADYNVNVEIAKEIVARTTIFTTHTPVAAGHDEFPRDLVKPYLVPLQQRLQVSADEMLSWGQAKGSPPQAPLSMFVLGLRMAQYCNGVSELHGRVARQMWAHVWPGRPMDEVPISHITNGVHIPSWVSIDNSLLFERYLGPEWYMKTGTPEMKKRIDQIYDEELWRGHEMSRSRLIRLCRILMARQYGRRNAPKSVMKSAESVLDQDVCTIVFARRFATYKRANLLLQDPQRFEAILTSKEHPVQFIFSGKAHPRDNEGKDLIKRLIQFARNPIIRHKLVFLEDYDINIARHLVQGADVWLNTPRRPYEACGTSGIKAAANGVLNVSILDGWWCEGYSEDRGWRIGNGEEYEDHAYQDMVESQALYNILENDVIPCFYDRKDGEIPVVWLKKMKESMKTAMHEFCAGRMVGDYYRRFYEPAAKRLETLVADDSREAKALFEFHKRLESKWKSIKVFHPVRDADGPFRVGESFNVSLQVELGDLRPEEVEVELYYGTMRAVDEVEKGYSTIMDVKEEKGGGTYVYTCTISCDRAGRYGFTSRVKPRGDDMIRNAPGFITWA